ncbi:maltose operon protein MalM [Zobellella endophytica]|uniref:Maltose operon protein MalM n=1 Tax=Zobellella endophytica TaxID=2116700 RepID=A0A2P7RBE4_9GAMM|nr:MalM family protein [Zobellella endophytica]PSJ47541.1 maltose operon protein MalM [Zobellella endophytica]
MNNTLMALCLGSALLAAQPVAAAEVPPALPAIGQQQLAALHWQPLAPTAHERIVLDAASPRLDTGLGEGPVAAFALPADRGTLDITLHSLVSERHQVFAPNVLILDERLQPAAFYPSEAFPFASGRLLQADRLEGHITLTPMPGQQRVYMLVFTRAEDLARVTLMPHPAKVHARALGNQPPAIADVPVVHRPAGTLGLRLVAEQRQGVTPLGVSPSVAAERAAVAPLAETESYFLRAIRTAVAAGDIDQALSLLAEAERLGVTRARAGFVEAVQAR